MTRKIVAHQDAVPSRPTIEAMIAKTVKLPISLDERLRRYCYESRRTGQDIMLEAVRMHLDRLDQLAKG